jgi:hypothetical protein
VSFRVKRVVHFLKIHTFCAKPTSPANGSRFNAPTAIPVTADATDTDGSVTSVRFFANGNLIGTDMTAPYQIEWSGMQRGINYVLTARATDNENAESSSSPISISVNGNSKYDFDGDGKTDISIFRPSLGEWWIMKSSTGGNYAAQFGISSDKLTPGDFTGDGKMDATVYRSSNTTWYSQRTTAGTLIQSFGQSGDTPIPNAFVP